MINQLIEISESGMTFGPYDKDYFFHIEKSNLYRDVSRNNGVKIAECLFLKNVANKLVLNIIEAKLSSPRPSGVSFNKYICQIRDKFINALSLCYAAYLGRHGDLREELPLHIKSMNLSQITIKFVLVINGHPKDWLPPINDALTKLLRPTTKTWGISQNAVVVLNDEMALNRGFISSVETCNLV